MDNATSKTIGIIGGAGPMAGLLLTRKVIEVCQKKYNCAKDADFPRLILLSVPFAEMLQPNTENQDEVTVSKQLQEAIRFLLSGSVSYFAVACNTLHGFLDDAYTGRLISLISETERFVAEQQFVNVLVLATSTSASNKVHDFGVAKQLPRRQQEAVDKLIARVLSGDVSSEARKKLKDIVQSLAIQDRSVDAVLLGCTELSLLMDGARTDFFGIDIIDPVEIVAKVLCNNIFNNQSS